jgi:hypothetical protein
MPKSPKYEEKGKSRDESARGWDESAARASAAQPRERAPHAVRALRVLVPAYRNASAASSISRTIGR